MREVWVVTYHCGLGDDVDVGVEGVYEVESDAENMAYKLNYENAERALAGGIHRSQFPTYSVERSRLYD